MSEPTAAAPGYFARHIFFCLNERANGEACCAQHGAQAAFEHCKSRAKAAGLTGFHPHHVAPGHYHKDAAYHNGAVWPWLNGIAIQRMIELGQADLAWRLFTYTNEIALTRGVVVERLLTPPELGR